jgi:hypothetical protein
MSQQPVRHLGRFRMNDGRVTTTDVIFPPSGSRSTATRTRDLAEKVEIARFDGPHFTAEREGDALIIFCIGDDTGVAGVNVIGTTDRDRAPPPPQTTADLQKLYDRAYERRDNFKQRADSHSASQALADHVRR